MTAFDSVFSLFSSAIQVIHKCRCYFCARWAKRSWLSLCAGSCWAYFGAESLFAKLRVLKTSVGFFAYLIASSFKYSVTCLWASLGGKPSCSSADFNKLLSLSGSIKYGFIYFSYPFFKFMPRRYYRYRLSGIDKDITTTGTQDFCSPRAGVLANNWCAVRG